MPVISTLIYQKTMVLIITRPMAGANVRPWDSSFLKISFCTVY
jgi:hypothetical protein